MFNDLNDFLVRMSNNWLVVVVTVVLTASASTVSAGQATGEISGTVTDESGGVLPGVTVTVTGTDTTRLDVSDGEGRYEIADLAPGPYGVQAVLPGFRSDTSSVTVSAGGISTASLTLLIAPLAETVTVTRTDQD